MCMGVMLISDGAGSARPRVPLCGEVIGFMDRGLVSLGGLGVTKCFH